MRRRDFLAVAGGLAVGWPLRAFAQPPKPVIGFLNSSSLGQLSARIDAFRQGLRTAGYSEDRNVSIVFRWADDQNDRLPALAAELVRRRVDVIVANSVAALAAQSATATIPIVFMTGGDPVTTGLVSDLAQPGRNISGVSSFDHTLEAKKLEFLHELIPQGAGIAALVNPNNPDRAAQAKELSIAARDLGRELTFLRAAKQGDFAGAFDFLAQHAVKALVVAGDPFFNSRRKALIALAARDSVAAVYPNRDCVEDGGLLSYGSDRRQTYHDAGIYTAQILNGTKPADLPILRPMHIELIINLRTARSLALDISPALLDRADEVIA
jgi:putative ABC transport system substrate-binding protein